jgi:hypothetical protein
VILVLALALLLAAALVAALLAHPAPLTAFAPAAHARGVLASGGGGSLQVNCPGGASLRC